MHTYALSDRANEMGGECEREREQEWESGRECVRAERSLTVMRERASTSTATPAALPKPRTLQHQKKYIQKKNTTNNGQYYFLWLFPLLPHFYFSFQTNRNYYLCSQSFGAIKANGRKRERVRERGRERGKFFV